MSNPKIKPENEEPLFIEKPNGMGYNLNFKNPKAYWFLAFILFFPIAVLVFAICMKK